MYNFSMNIKISMIGAIPPSISSTFPHAEDIVLNSIEFETMMETVSICKDAFEEVLLAVNLANRMKFKMLNEINPIVSGVPTISKEWGENEIAKMWMVEANKDFEKTKKINAFALAQVWDSSAKVSSPE